MKKSLLLIFILPLFILMGCTKKPTTVYEYSKEAEKTIKKYITLGVFAHYKDSKGTMFISYWKKDGKTKENVFSPLDSKSKTQICKNNKCVFFEENDKNAIVLDDKKLDTQVLIYPLIHWSEFYNIDNKTKGKFVSNNYKINDYSCRLIKIEDEFELCINDEYGIAVYARSDGKYPYEYNVKEIFTDNIYDSNFDLPEGMTIKK